MITFRNLRIPLTEPADVRWPLRDGLARRLPSRTIDKLSSVRTGPSLVILNARTAEPRCGRKTEPHKDTPDHPFGCVLVCVVRYHRAMTNTWFPELGGAARIKDGPAGLLAGVNTRTYAIAGAHSTCDASPFCYRWDVELTDGTVVTAWTCQLTRPDTRTPDSPDFPTVGSRMSWTSVDGVTVTVQRTVMTYIMTVTQRTLTVQTPVAYATEEEARAEARAIALTLVEPVVGNVVTITPAGDTPYLLLDTNRAMGLALVDPLDPAQRQCMSGASWVPDTHLRRVTSTERFPQLGEWLVAREMAPVESVACEVESERRTAAPVNPGRLKRSWAQIVIEHGGDLDPTRYPRVVATLARRGLCDSGGTVTEYGIQLCRERLGLVNPADQLIAYVVGS